MENNIDSDHSGQDGSGHVQLEYSTGSVRTYAYFYARFSATFLDEAVFACMGIPFWALAVYLSDVQGYELFAERLLALLGPVFWVLFVLYISFRESSSSQNTYGKRSLGIHVATLDGRRVSYLKALVRNYCKYLLWVAPCLLPDVWLLDHPSVQIFPVILILANFITYWRTSQRQLLHDLIAGTVVKEGHATVPVGVAMADEGESNDSATGSNSQ